MYLGMHIVVTALACTYFPFFHFLYCTITVKGKRMSSYGEILPFLQHYMASRSVQQTKPENVTRDKKKNHTE